MSDSRRIRIEEVLVHLGIDDDRLLMRLREEGLFQADEVDAYQADEIRVAALMIKELGLNPAGVHVALHLRRRLMALEARTETLVSQLHEIERRTNGDENSR